MHAITELMSELWLQLQLIPSWEQTLMLSTWSMPTPTTDGVVCAVTKTRSHHLCHHAPALTSSSHHSNDGRRMPPLPASPEHNDPQTQAHTQMCREGAVDFCPSSTCIHWHYSSSCHCAGHSAALSGTRSSTSSGWSTPWASQTKTWHQRCRSGCVRTSVCANPDVHSHMLEPVCIHHPMHFTSEGRGREGVLRVRERERESTRQEEFSKELLVGRSTICCMATCFKWKRKK